jgi:serine/threonine protein kinase
MYDKIVPSLIHDTYKVFEHIGGGSFGQIYKAIDMRTNTPVAIKFVLLITE